MTHTNPHATHDVMRIDAHRLNRLMIKRRFTRVPPFAAATRIPLAKMRDILTEKVPPTRDELEAMAVVLRAGVEDFTLAAGASVP
jgi:hypothetical protein